MDAQIVEAGHHQDRDGERHSCHTDLRGIPTPCKRQGQDNSTSHVIKTVIRVCEAGVGVRFVGLEAELMKLSFLLCCQWSLQIVHFYIINNL